ncbi:MAG: hypothetical protein ABIP51_22295 [Bacteroidia bacterium]
MNTTLNIFDEDGFIAILNADKYHSFVDTDWELEQLMTHFVNQMNCDTLVIWATNTQGGNWRVKFMDKPSSEKVYRQFNKTIQVTSGELYLTNYTDLTMAAQFADDKIPSKHNSNLLIKLPNGKYDLQVRQMFDPVNFDNTSDPNIYEVVISSADTKTETIDQVFWWTE